MRIWLGLLTLALALVVWARSGDVQATAPPERSTDSCCAVQEPEPGAILAAAGVEPAPAALAQLAAYLARPTRMYTDAVERPCVGGCAYVAPPPRCDASPHPMDTYCKYARRPSLLYEPDTPLLATLHYTPSAQRNLPLHR